MGIQLSNIQYKYKAQQSDSQKPVLDQISITIEDGEYVAIVGKTGSGKSTLLQHLNGLLKADSGSYYCDGEDVYAAGYSLNMLRRKVALCFQYPEYQLFEETILKDICFGPLNLGYSQEEARQIAREAMSMVGLSTADEKKSPFSLSGGQKRRVALAGILAMKPRYLVLDEPVAGLDQTGKQQLFDLLKKLNKEEHITIILVSHDMDDVIKNAERVIILKDGQVALDGPCRNIFARKEEVEAAGLEIPVLVDFTKKLFAGWGQDYHQELQPTSTKELAELILAHKEVSHVS